MKQVSDESASSWTSAGRLSLSWQPTGWAHANGADAEAPACLIATGKVWKMRGESEDNEWRERWDDQICKTTCLFSLCLFFRYIFIYFFSSLLPFSPLFSLVLLSRQTDCDTHAHTRVAPSPVGPPHISLILPRSMRVMVVLPCRRRLTMCVHNHITLGPKLMFLARTPLKLGLCPSALPPRRLQNDEESQGGLDSYV